MKKIFIIALLAFVLMSCAKEKTLYVEGKTQVVKPYGLFNPEDKKDSVTYHVSFGNVIWSCVLCETIVVPVYLCGWGLYEPVETK